MWKTLIKLWKSIMLKIKFDKNYNFEDLSESKKILYKYIENFN